MKPGQNRGVQQTSSMRNKWGVLALDGIELVMTSNLRVSCCSIPSIHKR